MRVMPLAWRMPFALKTLFVRVMSFARWVPIVRVMLLVRMKPFARMKSSVLVMPLALMLTVSGPLSVMADGPESSAVVFQLYEEGGESEFPEMLQDSLRTLWEHAGTQRDMAHQEITDRVIPELMARYYASGGFFNAGIDSVRVLTPDDGPVGIHIYTQPGCRFSIGSLSFRMDADWVAENRLAGPEVTDSEITEIADVEFPEGADTSSPDLADLSGAVPVPNRADVSDPLHVPEELRPDQVISFYGEGDVYDAAVLEDEFRRYIRHYELQGYPLAGIAIVGFQPDPENCEVSIIAEIDPGERFYAAGVRVGGLRQHDPDYIQTASGIRQQDLVTPGLFQRGRRNLENTEFFHDVSEGDIRMREGEPYVYYDVTERRANNFDVMFGYAPRQVDGYNVIGRGALLIRNVGWSGSSLNLSFERLEDMVTRLRTGYGRQWIGGLPLGAEMQFFFLQQDTSYQVREWEVQGSYNWTPERRVTVSLTQENADANSNPDLPIRVLDGVTRSAGVGFNYDNTDSRLSPTRGMIFDLHIASAFRRVTDSRVEELESRGSMIQQRVRSSFKTYLSPFPRHVAAFRLYGATVESPEYTETDLMRLGGSRSIRGYREEQFRVGRYAWGDLEYRYLLDPYSHAFLFAAGGAYERPEMVGEQDTGTSDWLYSGGFGFRYRTPIGIMQFTYAVSADDPLHNGKVHFNLTADF